AIIDHGRIVALDSPEALKSRMGGDVITIDSPDPEGLAAGLRDQFGEDGNVRVTGPRQVVVEREAGAQFVPRAVAAFPGLVEAVSVRRPTLDDVFLKLTGRAIREEEGSAIERMRVAARFHGRGHR